MEIELFFLVFSVQVLSGSIIYIYILNSGLFVNVLKIRSRGANALLQFLYHWER